MDRIDQAKQVRDDARAAVVAAGLPEVIATLDAADVPSGSRHGVIVVDAPKLTFGPVEITPVFELHVIAGPVHNYLAAWERIDQLIQALADSGLNLASGEPGGYEAPDRTTYPAYTLTLNPLDFD